MEELVNRDFNSPYRSPNAVYGKRPDWQDVFKEAIENLKNEYITHWLNSRDINDVTAREDLHRSLLLLPEVERHLRIIAEKGKLTKANINKIRNIG